MNNEQEYLRRCLAQATIELAYLEICLSKATNEKARNEYRDLIARCKKTVETKKART